MWWFSAFCAFLPDQMVSSLGAKGASDPLFPVTSTGLVLSKCIWKWWLEGGGGVTAKPLTDLSVCKSFLRKIYGNFFAQRFASLDIKKSNWEHTWHSQNSASMVHGHWLSFPPLYIYSLCVTWPLSSFWYSSSFLPETLLPWHLWFHTLFFLSRDAFTVFFAANTPPWSW